MDESTANVDAPSKPPLRFRRVRILASGLFGLLAVAILVLCVRRRTNIDAAGIGLRSGDFLAVTSSRGALELAREKLPFSPDDKEGFGTYSMHLPRFDHEATTIPYRISWKTSN